MIREKGTDGSYPWVVAVSASLQENEVARARDCGVNDFLGKPFFAQQLADKILEIPWIESRRRNPDEAQGSPELRPAEVHEPLFVEPYYGGAEGDEDGS